MARRPGPPWPARPMAPASGPATMPGHEHHHHPRHGPHRSTRYPDAASFAGMMRSGKRPDGSAITVMPFEALSKMNDTDLEAMRLFLATLLPRPAGGR